MQRNEALFLGYVQFINGEEKNQELLFQNRLETDTKDESIFKVVQELFEEKQIPLTNIVA